MEFIFILISLLFAAAMLILIPVMIYDSWSRGLRSIRRQFTDDDGLLGLLYIGMGLMVAMMIFMILCAINNSIWHLDYWTVEGVWHNK